MVNGVVYQYRALPMGLTSSPRIFTRVIKVIKEYVQKLGVTLYLYLDDWLVQAHSWDLVAQHTNFLVQVAQGLGWIVNVDKSELDPTQTIVFLGYMYMMDRGLVRPSPDRWDKIQAILPLFLEKKYLPARMWQSAIGLLASTEKLVPLGMLHLRPLQLSLGDQWSQFRGKQSDLVYISQEVKEEVEWWLREENTLRGVVVNRNTEKVP